MEVSRKQELTNTIIQEAWSNPSFKQALENDPKAALENLLGSSISLPEGKRFQVVDQTHPDIIYINIPSPPQVENMELNEAQLEAVAGGIMLLPPSLGDYLEDLINHKPGEDGR